MNSEMEQPTANRAGTPSLLELLRESWLFSKEHFTELTGIALKWVIGPMVLFVLLLAVFHSTPMLAVTLAVVVLIVFVPLICFAYGGVTEIALARVQDREARFRFGRGGAILGVSTLVFLLEMIPAVPLQLAKLTLIATIVNVFFYIRFGLLLQVIVAEDTNLDAIGRTWNLWKGNGNFLASRMIGYYLLILAALGVPSLLLLLSFGGISRVANPMGAPNWPLFLLLCSLIMIPAVYISLYIDPFFKALLYQEVRGSKLRPSEPEIVPPVIGDTGMYDFNR